MAFQFPANPTLGQTFTPVSGVTTYRWSGIAWHLTAPQVVPPPTSHRYWRINSIVVPGGGYLELCEIRVFEGAVDVTPSATKTSSTAPFSPIENLFDGDTYNQASWTEAVAEGAGFWIQFVFPTPTDLNGVAQGGYDNSARYMQGFALQFSDDGSAWSTLGTKSGLVYPGNKALSPIITFP